MSDSDLQDLSQHINNKTSKLRHVLELRTLAKDPDNVQVLRRLGQDVHVIDGLLDQLERCVVQQRHLLTRLQEVEGSLQQDVQDGRHLRDNLPTHLPRRKEAAAVVGSAQTQMGSAEQPGQENSRKSSRKPVREMVFITRQEFDSIPQYMRGRVTYDQLNAAVQNINTAIKGKYKILSQPAKNLNNSSRKLQQRFREEETKDTKGQVFVVEADIKEFTQLKVDKRFQGILSMLRRCQRLREVRGGGLTRYVLM